MISSPLSGVGVIRSRRKKKNRGKLIPFDFLTSECGFLFTMKSCCDLILYFKAAGIFLHIPLFFVGHINNDHDDDNEMINDDDNNDDDDDNNDDSDKVSGRIIVSLGLFKLTKTFF